MLLSAPNFKDMGKLIPSLALMVTALIHLIPVMGAFGRTQLLRLYEIPVDDPNWVILLRHRAVLFFILGGFLLLAAYKEELRFPAYVFGLISMLSFSLIYYLEKGAHTGLFRVSTIDLIVSAALLIVAVLDGFGFKVFIEFMRRN